MIKSLLVALFTATAVVASSNVVDLTPDNFDSIVDGSKDVLVEFYAPWCGHCKTLAPVYEQVANAFSLVSDKVVVAKVNADDHKTLASRFSVKGYPTLKWFKKGGNLKEPTDFSGARTFDSLISFIGLESRVSPKVKPEITHVVELTDKNFDEYVMNKDLNVLVEFYAPWCGHCKKLVPIYDQIATAFQAENSCVIAKLDADKHKDIGSKYGVQGFPTIKLFTASDKKNPVDFEGERDAETIVKFINEHCGTFRTPDGLLNDQAGRIAKLDEFVTTFISSASDRAKILSDAKDYVKDSAVEYGEYYVKVMEKMLEKTDFAKGELKRLALMTATGKLAPELIKNLYSRMNILKSFMMGEDQEDEDAKKEEEEAQKIEDAKKQEL